MFIAEVVGVQVSEKYLDENGKFWLNHSDLVAHSSWRILCFKGKELGNLSYSVKK